MTTYDIPERVLHGLKCGLCSEPLSYPPITLSAENGSVCGRCPTLEAENNTQPLREDSYERVASMFNFPCRYTPQGCMEKLPMKNVVTHEQSCTFKPYFCPMLPLGSCAWQGSSTELHGHFAISHQINLLENPMFELNIVTNYKDLYLVPYLGQLFLLRTEFNCSDEIFRFSLHFVGSSESAEKYEYELVFLTSNEDAQWTHPKKQVDTDENILDRKNECTVSLGSLKEILQVPTTITCKLNINVTQEGLCKESSSSNLVNLEENLLEDLYEGAVCEEIEYEDDDDSDEERDIKKAIIDDSVDKMMLDMECPVCQEVMIPPIYQCVVGHSVCDACKPKLKECPTCRNTIANTRNFTLERISENLRYKCKNRIDGCTFETNSSGIRQHEVECKFNPHHCPLHNILNCDWLGKANKIFTHVKSKHPDHFQDNSIFSVPYNSTCVSNESMKIMRVHGEIFKIRFNYSNQMKQVSCTVQFTGPNTEASRFMYEMHVMDMNNTGLQLMSKKYCGASSDDIDDLKHCTMWHLDMVLPFASTENLLKLRCVVTKV